MQLIGMLDSPYVRRVAISLKLMGLDFEHRPLSVFRNFEEFREINPVVKAPTLVCDDGDGAHGFDAHPRLPRGAGAGGKAPHAARRHGAARGAQAHGIRAQPPATRAFRSSTSASAAPPEKRHEPWYERVLGQTLAAFTALEDAAGRANPWLQGAGPNAADIAVAVAWRFNQYYHAQLVPAWKFPSLAKFSAQAEALPSFESTPLDPPAP